MLRSGLIGRDILASRSPWLHEQEARALGGAGPAAPLVPVATHPALRGAEAADAAAWGVSAALTVLAVILAWSARPRGATQGQAGANIGMAPPPSAG